MKKLMIFSALFWSGVSSAQDLNWNTISGYTTGNLTHNFGIIGSPASAVNMAITGNTGLINGGFPVLYIAAGPGSCAAICALRTGVTFGNTTQTLIYTFTFASPVSGLTFSVYDVDGNGTSGAGGIRDRLAVTATDGTTAQNITMTDVDGITSVTGSGGTTPVATALVAGATDNRVNISIAGNVATLVITFGSDPTGSAGSKSFSIGNMDWTGVLPVRWISFSGKMQTNGSVDLNWITETEVNASHYEIERSKDGQNYAVIGQLAARGGGRTTYLFTDITPGPGNSFYRIRQVDIGGRFEFSNIVLIRPGKNNGSGFTITPNPASQYILVSSDANVQVNRLQIYDATGRMVYESKAGINRVDVSSFKPGFYNVRIENKSGDIFTEPFIKR